MGYLGHGDIPNCQPQHRAGVVKAINTETLTLNVEINSVLYENVEVHYHCPDAEWDNHSHPHSDDEREQMLSAFEIDDGVLVMCDDSDDEELNPLYVEGFLEGPKPCYNFICLPVPEQMSFATGGTATFEGRFDWYGFDGKKGAAPAERERVGNIMITVINITTPCSLKINGVELPGSKLYWQSGSDADWLVTGTPQTFEINGHVTGGYSIPYILVNDYTRGDQWEISFVSGGVGTSYFDPYTYWSASIMYPLNTKNIWSAHMQAVYNDFPVPAAYNRGWCIGHVTTPYMQREQIYALNDENENMWYDWMSSSPWSIATPIMQAKDLIKPGCEVGYSAPEICQDSHTEISCRYDFQLKPPLSDDQAFVFRVKGSHLEDMFDAYGLEKPDDESIEIFFDMPDEHKALQWGG